jgi:hypothetical protein
MPMLSLQIQCLKAIDAGQDALQEEGKPNSLIPTRIREMPKQDNRLVKQKMTYPIVRKTAQKFARNVGQTIAQRETQAEGTQAERTQAVKSAETLAIAPGVNPRTIATAVDP